MITVGTIIYHLTFFFYHIANYIILPADIGSTLATILAMLELYCFLCAIHPWYIVICL